MAATLLDDGRTAHSALKLALNMNVNENPTCNVSKNWGMGKVLQQCKLIVCDECTMAHKQALDRTLQDLRSNDQQIFGGALILLAGDFRQTLPVIPRSIPADELKACLKSSYLWRHVQILLTTNVRVQIQKNPSADTFSRQLLAIGNGQLAVDRETGLITLPDNFCNIAPTKAELVSSVFPNIAENYRNHNWLAERAILAAKNKDVGQMNADILTHVPGEVVTYQSVDTVTNSDDAVNYPTEFLNSLDLPGFSTSSFTIESGCSHYYASKYKLTTIVQLDKISG